MPLYCTAHYTYITIVAVAADLAERARLDAAARSARLPPPCCCWFCLWSYGAAFLVLLELSYYLDPESSAGPRGTYRHLAWSKWRAACRRKGVFGWLWVLPFTRHAAHYAPAIEAVAARIGVPAAAAVGALGLWRWAGLWILYRVSRDDCEPGVLETVFSPRTAGYAEAYAREQVWGCTFQSFEVSYDRAGRAGR
jgi:hypothetical protein